MSQFVNDDYLDAEGEESDVEQESDEEQETLDEAYEASQRLDEDLGDLDGTEPPPRVDDGESLRQQVTSICLAVATAVVAGNLAFLKIMVVIIKSEWLRNRIKASTCPGIDDLRKSAKVT